MKRTKKIVATILLTGTLSFPVLAEDSDRRIPPYGHSFTVYGACRQQMRVHEAMQKVEDYFAEREMTIEMREIRGRFIRVNVFDNKEQVDSVIIDTKTGRMRSVY